MTRMIDTSTRHAPTGALTEFGRREDGSLTIFGLLIFILMLTAGGIALDIMRSEVARTELQYAADRATLAAAGLNQTRTAEEIVKDYVRAAGLDEDSIDVVSVQNGQDRRVTISADSLTDSLFLDLLGINTLVQPISSEAREVRTELELSLVVDISGSMGGAKIETLRTAASDFVAELLRNREDLTSISLVPYNDRVNAGSLLNSVFDISDEHPFSNCVVFSDADFTRLDMGPGDELQRMGHFDFRTNFRRGNEPGLVENPNCRTDNYGAVLPWSNNVGELQARIADLDASHFTAMDLGVKWGSLLLDPSSRDELNTLATAADLPQGERVDSDFIGRPVNYNTEGTHKVLVVMTDGVNTQQWDVRADRKSNNVNDSDHNGYGFHAVREPLDWVCRNYLRNQFLSNGERRDGLSNNDASLCDSWHSAGRPSPDNSGSGSNNDIFGDDIIAGKFGVDGAGCQLVSGETRSLCRATFDSTEGNRYVTRYSVWSSDVNAYWIDHLNRYWSAPYRGNQTTELSWSEVLGSLSMSYIANTILSGANWNTRVDYFNSWETTHRQARADNNLSEICERARNSGVVIYTIAFQAEPDGEAAMLDCAGVGNEARYFDVEDLDIAAAFDDVLASVSRLRLTQ